MNPNVSSRSMRTAAGALLVLAAAACGDRVTGPPVAQQDQLLFLKHQPGPLPPYLRTTDIWRINADGTGAVNLTNHPAIYASVNLSPDGRTVAFHSERESPRLNMHVWLMDADGTNLRRLTTADGDNHAPRWSPDGSRIAYQNHTYLDLGPGAGGQVVQVVYVAPVNGGTPIDVSSAAIAADAPCSTGVKTRLELIGWTPGGSVLFSNYICGEGYRHYIVGADGSNPRRYEFDPFTTFWSPDGSRVGFTQQGAQQGAERVMTAGADGSGMRELTDQPGRLALPRRVLPLVSTEYNPWSPDGSQLVVQRWSTVGAETQFELAAINADGSDMRPLTDMHASFNGWSAGGDKVAFTNFASGTYSVFIVNADGTGMLNLTAGSGDATNAIWLPRR